MSAPGTTPGPWFLDSDKLTIHAPDPDEPNDPWAVASICLGCGWPGCDDEANAHLIAAAPELYDALLEVRRVGDDKMATLNEWVAAKVKADAALAKAEGKQP